MELEDRRFAVSLGSVILGMAVMAMGAPLLSPDNLGLLAAALTSVVGIVAAPVAVGGSARPVAPGRRAPRNEKQTSLCEAYHAAPSPPPPPPPPRGLAPPPPPLGRPRPGDHGTIFRPRGRRLGLDARELV